MENDYQNIKDIRRDRQFVRNNTYLITKIIINLRLILFGARLIGISLSSVQTSSSLAKQQENNNLAISEVSSILAKNEGNSVSISKIYHDGNWNSVEDIKKILSNGLFEKLMLNNDNIRAQIFTELESCAGVSYLYIMDDRGNILIGSDESMIGRNPASSNIMTQENLNRILAGIRNEAESVPVLVKNQFGTYYFYGKPYEYEDTRYSLVAGTSSGILDERVGALKDVSAVLSRMGVINDGFLFAVSKTDNLFLYYKNGNDFLTGQNAFSTGLNEEIMTDGYQGLQTILGEKYYCTSKVLDSDTVIVAAARSEDVVSHERFVLIGPILGFLIVMILCVVYAIIVSKDFARQGIQPDKLEITGESKNPVYFNKSIFKKIFPLMLLGVLAVFGISFYTQTLVEITEGVDKSTVILQEINGRYEESVDSEKIIEDYNNTRFLSTARMIEFFVEENPEVLNASSDFYHSVYDQDGNRQYLLDDEGNRLKSVSDSVILQTICDENRIDAIYIFDEDGHTIATNTSNWFFTISHNENDQSYPFLQVLDGKLESFVQESMLNDLGERAQFFGVVLHYYTTKDASGNTVYVSRYAYEEACAAAGVSGVKSVAGITRHRSLLQVQLNEDLVNSIMLSSSPEYVLSTKMLSGGAVVLFDTSKDHVCVYSPVRASIGKTAEELGVSSKAFSGEVYYGFTRVNGVSYFRYFRYIDDYFIATAIPQSSMFTSRMTISLITAGVCLIMITFLMLTITLTSKEEEELYEHMINEYTEDDLNSAIFNIILPSGRQASTTRASIRWDNRHIPWNERSPEMKLGIILGWISFIVILYFALTAWRINRISDSDEVIRYIFSGNWDRSPNLFSMSACFMVLIVTVIIIELFKIPIRLCTTLLGTRGETVGHLLLSLVKYGGTIFSLFYCMYLMGIDSGNLLASAGILSLVIGLGSQSLIKDIIAGIFIVFEGEFRVGDIVTINGFRGRVTDIGLRTTKISGEGNIKIFNNSEISGVLNMTKETSVAMANIGLEYGQDFEYVEEVLERELPLLKENNKQILDGPTSLGITDMQERRYVITIMARCSEQYIREVNRYLNKELLQIMYRNGIRVANQNNTLIAARKTDGEERK